MSKKELVYQGLEKLPVAIEDRTYDSPNYFRVTKLPTEFNAGINIFRFKGNSELFLEGAEVLIEILDSNGDPIYYEIGLDLESAEQTAIVTIYVNQDTAPGNGMIYLCSTLRKTVEGKLLDIYTPNIRWSAPMYIDVSKVNPDEIVFNNLPAVSVTTSTGSYTKYSYGASSRINSVTYGNIFAPNTIIGKYLYRNNQPVILLTGTGLQFSSSADLATVTALASRFKNSVPSIPSSVNTAQTVTGSIVSYTGSTIAYLREPLSFVQSNSNTNFYPTQADLTLLSVEYTLPASASAQITENSHNLVIVYFSRLQPQSGIVSKIRSYYRSTGLSEYIFTNETDISSLSEEKGFTPNVVTASFVIPTTHRNDRIDFKFEFVNPAGNVSKQVVESLNNLFTGGNTYIGGDDNLLTGSLFVAGATGTGVHISGKGSAAMVRSIGYEGFAKAVAGTSQAGFVLYSGSVQPLLNSTEVYGGVGLELVANSSSYFKYSTENSGSLEVRTNRFFFGSNTSYISSSNGSMSILSDNFRLTPEGYVTASAILVRKDVGGTPQIMIDTNKAILDATNIGRFLYSNTTEYTLSGSGAGAGIVGMPIGEFVFQGLQNEYLYLVSFQSKIEITSISSGTGTPNTTLTWKLKYANSGSTTAGNTFYDEWTLQDSQNAVLSRTSGTGTGVTSKTFSEDQSSEIDISTSNVMGKLFKAEVSMSVNFPAALNAVITGSVKNITLTATRGIGSSWGQTIGGLPA